MTKESNTFGFLHYCFLSKFKVRCSNSWFIILSCGACLKMSKLSHAAFFPSYISLLAEGLNQISNKERRHRACLFAETAGNLFDFSREPERVQELLRISDLTHAIIQEGSWPGFASNVSSIVIFFLFLADLKMSVGIQIRVCVCFCVLWGGCVKPEGVCSLSILWGRDGWPCIMFYSCVCTGGGNNSVILEQQTQ